MKQIRASALSPARRQLVATILDINHGRIEHLHVRRGEPLFDPGPTIVRCWRPDRRNGPHPHMALGDFVLNDRFAWLLAQLGTNTCEIRELVISDGLPVRCDLVETKHC